MGKCTVPVARIEQGIASYLDAELMPQLQKGGVEKVIIGTVASLAIRKAGDIANSYKDNKVVKMLGIMDSNGNVDVETLVEEIKKNIDDDGFTVDIPMMGEMTFQREDIDKLYGFIQEV